MKNPSLKFQDWPAQDRRAWDRATAPGSVFDDEGLAARWRPATQNTNRHHYGRFLAFLRDKGILDVNAQPGDRCAPEALKRYVEQLSATTRPVSVRSSVIGLKSVLQALAPARDWSWMNPIICRLNAGVKASRRPGQLLDARVIFHKAIAHMRALSREGVTTGNTRAEFRNALMLALLVACPLRRKNLAELSVGSTLRRSGDGWCISFSSTDVKNSRPIEYEIPKLLVPFLEKYLAEIRPALLGTNDSGALWINAFGDPMKGRALYLGLTKFTKRVFGVQIAPHDLRSVTGTMLAFEGEDYAYSASALLGHHDSRVTEEHYLKARNIEASRHANEVLRAASWQAAKLMTRFRLDEGRGSNHNILSRHTS